MIPSEVIDFFHNQHFTVISTIDENGYPHNITVDVEAIVDLIPPHIKRKTEK